MRNLKIQTRSGTPIQAGNVTIQPVSQSVSWISQRFGFVWNRPYAVRVDDGQTTHQIAIIDRTRIALVILWGLSALFSLMSAWRLFSNWRKTND